MKALLLGLLCLVLCAGIQAQSTTTSATITDTDGQTWNYGTYSFVFQPSPANPIGQYYWNGVPFSKSQTISGNLTSAGFFTQSVPSNTSINPSGSTWLATVCPAASAPCYAVTLTITGATQDLTTQLVPPGARVNLTNPPAGVTAYTDAEIVGAKPGSFYFNITDETLHFCTQTGFPPCQWTAVVSSPSLLAANNAFTGNNTHSKTETFTGTINCTIVNAVRCISPLNPQGWSGSDAGAWVNSAYANCAAAGLANCPIDVAAGTYNFSTPIVFATNGVYPTLRCPPQTTMNYTPTSGTVITMNPGSSGLPGGWGISGCKFLGPGRATSTSTALLLGGANGAVGARFTNGFYLGGFNLGITFENNAFNIAFDGIYDPDNNQGFLYPSGLTNSGELITISHSVFSTTTANWLTNYIQVADSASIHPLTISDSSVDEVQIAIGGGTVNLVNLHMENPVSATIGSNSYVAISGGVVNITNPEFLSNWVPLPQYFVDMSGGSSLSLTGGFFGNASGTLTTAVHACSTCSLKISSPPELTSITNLYVADAGATAFTVDTNTKNVETTGTLSSTIATGTAPISVASTTPVSNLTVQNCSSCTIPSVTNSTGLQIFNTTTTCTTGASVGATCTTAEISLPVAEADTSYRIACTGKGVTNVPAVIATTNSSATQFTITIAALTAAAASFSSYDCVAGHN